MNKKYIRPPFDFPIPDILNESILMLLDAVDNQKEFIDCEQDDVYGAANMAFASNCITEEQIGRYLSC